MRHISLASTAILALSSVSAFSVLPRKTNLNSVLHRQPHTAPLMASVASRHYDSKRGDRRGRDGNEKSKRQERIGQLVKTELSRILHSGVIRGRDAEYLDEDLRQRISVVNADISPDLKQARVSISVRGPNRHKHSEGEEQEAYNPAVDKRRAYAWLVRNTKPIRHTLAQKMSHMKTSPNLTFVQVDVAAATDVMYLIDKVAAGYKREKVGGFGEDDMPTGILHGMDFDEEFDEEDWEEEDDGFFSN